MRVILNGVDLADEQRLGWALRAASLLARDYHARRSGDPIIVTHTDRIALAYAKTAEQMHAAEFTVVAMWTKARSVSVTVAR